MMPNGVEGVGQDIAEQKIRQAEEQIAGINRTIGQNREFCGAGRTSGKSKFSIVYARKEARAVNRPHARLRSGGDSIQELRERNGITEILAFDRVSVKKAKLRGLEREDVGHESRI